MCSPLNQYAAREASATIAARVREQLGNVDPELQAQSTS